MTEQHIQPHEEDEIKFLDILVTLAANWRLLVFGPLIAGLLAVTLSFLLPKTFESVAIVRMTEEEVALLHTAPVLDPLVEKFGLLVEADGVLDDARQDLKKRLIFSVDKKTKLATILAKAHTPDIAQAIGNRAIVEVLKQLQVKGKEKVLLEKTIAINSRAIESSEDAVESIQHSFKKGALPDQAQEFALKNLIAINSDIAKRSQENEELRQKLEPKGAEVFVQEPTLPQRTNSPKISLVAWGAIVASEFGLLIFIYVYENLKQIKQGSAASKKILLIRRSLGRII